MPIEESNIIWTITASGAVIFFTLLAILLPYLIIMHNILYRRLDSTLFKEPWFSPAQLIMFKSWPMSFIKTVIYMFLIAYPNYIRKKKRFRDLKNVPVVEPSIILACKLYTTLHVAMILIGVAWMLFIFSVFAMDNWFS